MNINVFLIYFLSQKVHLLQSKLYLLHLSKNKNRMTEIDAGMVRLEVYGHSLPTPHIGSLWSLWGQPPCSWSSNLM